MSDFRSYDMEMFYMCSVGVFRELLVALNRLEWGNVYLDK